MSRSASPVPYTLALAPWTLYLVASDSDRLNFEQIAQICRLAIETYF